ncbi:hypothetical protein MYK68_06015 [Gordonia sp. PP30]|uniref:hypothetical protein n=1 Tax=unclassified Gordonia (in: high G+C Gram-positive bacteria) TaxID=2657482 RepID=UPI001FFF6A81|nr:MULTISPECIES: hypothetical protein [unclassified Gordonia (in: high G+C Gram-positive bacteria)]UQE76145.1 hypothetical protein MYK68_06015 [Gordonia sp. PP30]
MSVPENWIPHRRPDGEVIGWIDLDAAAPRIAPYDRLGRALPAVDDWAEAEEALDDLGLRFLTGRFVVGGRTVRIRHVYDDHVVVTTALTDAVGDVGDEFRVSFPVGDDFTEAERRPGSRGSA